VSEQNLQAARRGFEAFNARDVNELIALADPDCEWLPFRAQLEGGSYLGHDGVRRFVADMEEDWSEFQIELDELSDHGEDVLLIGRVRAVARGSGLAVNNRVGFVLSYRDGRIHRLVSYSDPDAARSAAAP
jgi:ketosteroid isomerase-like protein